MGQLSLVSSAFFQEVQENVVSSVEVSTRSRNLFRHNFVYTQQDRYL
jgi:hypothetical protein